MRVSVLIVLAAVVLGLSVPALAVPPSPVLPLDHWAYGALDRLSGRGLIDSYLAGSRPLTRTEVARLLDEALRNAQLESFTPVDDEQLSRLRQELASELSELRGQGSAVSYFKPFRSVTMGYRQRDGRDSVLADRRPGAASGQIVARQWSLDVNNDGEDLSRDGNGILTAAGDVRLGWLLGEWRPRVAYGPENAGDEEFDSALLNGRGVLQLGPIELSAGRQSLWWGQGRHGSLLLTNNARPLDMVRLTNPHPAQLPWIFSMLGPVRFDLFWSRLEEQRVVSEPYLAGLRINLKPLPWFELGAARTVIFGGKGRPKVDTEEFVTILGGKNLSGGDDSSNSLAALDGRLRLPSLLGMELYGEYGGEDEAGHFLANTAWLAGVSFSRLEPSGRLTVRAERADISHVDRNSPLWYRHSIYRSGYTYHGKVLGHHVGGGGDDLSLQVELLLPADLALTLGWDAENRGSDQPVREEHRQWSVSCDWQPSAHWRVNTLIATDEIKNRGFVAGAQDRQSLVEFDLTIFW